MEAGSGAILKLHLQVEPDREMHFQLGCSPVSDEERELRWQLAWRCKTGRTWARTLQHPHRQSRAAYVAAQRAARLVGPTRFLAN